MVTDRTNIAVADTEKSHVALRLTCLYLTLANSKGQGHANFDYDYFANGDRQDKHYQCQYNSYVVFRLVYLHLTLARCKDQEQGHAHFDCEYLVNCDIQDIHYYCQHIESRTLPFYWRIYI